MGDDDNGNGDGSPQGYQDDNERSLKDEESRVRSKLSNERTFSAWLRTSTAVIAVGLAIARFLAREGVGEIWFLVLGTGYVLIGIGLIVYATYEYVTSHHEMKEAAYQAPKKFLFAIATILAVLSLGVMAAVFYGIMFD